MIPQLDWCISAPATRAPYDLRQLGPGKLRQPVHCLDRRAACRYRAHGLVLPDDAARSLGLRRRAKNDPRGPDIGGAPRQVIMQAAKNGFFYVLDRRSGKLLSGEELHLYQLGHRRRPEDRAARSPPHPTGMPPKNVYPSWAGGHTWNPMSFSAQTHLVYIPVIDMPGVWVDMLHNGGEVKFVDGILHRRRASFPTTPTMPADLKRLYGPLPSLKEIQADAQGEAGARAAARLGSDRAEDRVGAGDLERHPGLRWRRDVDRRQPRIPGSRQRRTVGVCGGHRQGAEGHRDRQPHHGRPRDLCSRRRAIRGCAGGLRRNGHRRGAGAAEQRHQ